jgi:hypothetical protein
MLTQSRRTRAVKFALLFGPPVFLRREDAAQVYGAVCSDLGYDDFGFRYNTAPVEADPASAFSVILERREGRGGIRILLDCQNVKQAPIRLFIENAWPPSPQHVVERADMIYKAVFKALEGRPWQNVMAEARILAQCALPGNDALAFLRRRVMPLPAKLKEATGQDARHIGAVVEFAGMWPREGEPLDGPERKLTIEVLREDPKCVYVEAVCQWRQVPGSATPGPVPAGRIREIGELPSAYIQATDEFLGDALRAWGEEKDAET